MIIVGKLHKEKEKTTKLIFYKTKGEKGVFKTMKKKTTVIMLMSMAVVLLGLGGFLGVYLYQENATSNPKVPTLNEAGLQTFADMTEVEQFQNIPLYVAEGVKMTEPNDRGDNVYMVTVNGTNREQYESYLQTLKDTGFAFFADNGEDGLDQSIYTSSFTGEGVTVTVTYYAKEETVYITSSAKMELSPRLIDKEEYRDGIIEGMKNTLYMYELYNYGNSFVIQLKNGHFLVNDGGRKDDIKYLIDRMEALAPSGEKPIVEAWFISHAHSDHQEALAALTEETSLLERLYIEGVYMNMPSDEAFNAVNQLSSKTAMMKIQTLPNYAKAADGSSTKIYRPQSGQQYYFCDVVVDIMHTQEQLVTQDYANLDLNDSSTWLMYNMDGQKFLLSGDADKGGMRMVMKNFSQEYMKLDVYTSFHHNINNWLPFLEYCEIKTTLFTTNSVETQNKKVGEINTAGANVWLTENSVDYYSWEDGGKVLTFPYKAGTAKSLPMQEWIYHKTRPQIQ